MSDARATPRTMKAAVVTQNAVKTIDRTNRVMIRIVISGCVAIVLMVAGFLGLLLNTINSNHGVNCQTNALVRSLDDDVNQLLGAAEHHDKPSPLMDITTPKGCQ
jgi:hypothetical protein